MLVLVVHQNCRLRPSAPYLLLREAASPTAVLLTRLRGNGRYGGVGRPPPPRS